MFCKIIGLQIFATVVAGHVDGQCLSTGTCESDVVSSLSVKRIYSDTHYASRRGPRSASEELGSERGPFIQEELDDYSDFASDHALRLLTEADQLFRDAAAAPSVSAEQKQEKEAKQKEAAKRKTQATTAKYIAGSAATAASTVGQCTGGGPCDGFKLTKDLMALGAELSVAIPVLQPWSTIALGGVQVIMSFFSGRKSAGEPPIPPLGFNDVKRAVSQALYEHDVTKLSWDMTAWSEMIYSETLALRTVVPTNGSKGSATVVDTFVNGGLRRLTTNIQGICLGLSSGMEQVLFGKDNFHSKLTKKLTFSSNCANVCDSGKGSWKQQCFEDFDAAKTEFPQFELALQQFQALATQLAILRSVVAAAFTLNELDVKNYDYIAFMAITQPVQDKFNRRLRASAALVPEVCELDEFFGQHCKENGLCNFPEFKVTGTSPFCSGDCGSNGHWTKVLSTRSSSSCKTYFTAILVQHGSKDQRMFVDVNGGSVSKACGKSCSSGHKAVCARKGVCLKLNNPQGRKGAGYTYNEAMQAKQAKAVACQEHMSNAIAWEYEPDPALHTVDMLQ